MKELSIEEKAKLYDEAYKKVAVRFGSNVADEIFLKESEDEKIRKWMIENIQETLDVDGFFEEQKTMAKKAIAWLEKQGEQKSADTEKGAKGNEREIPNSAWSEDDEAKFESCIKVLQTSDGYDTINAKWLKSLKDRVQPQQQEWSEKDERMFKNTIALIETLEDYNKAPNGFGDVKFWLKSLRERYTWKPSDEQMKMLDEVLNFAANHESPYWNDCIFGILNNLIKQLKKLMEE